MAGLSQGAGGLDQDPTQQVFVAEGLHMSRGGLTQAKSSEKHGMHRTWMCPSSAFGLIILPDDILQGLGLPRSVREVVPRALLDHLQRQRDIVERSASKFALSTSGYRSVCHPCPTDGRRLSGPHTKCVGRALLFRAVARGWILWASSPQ